MLPTDTKFDRWAQKRWENHCPITCCDCGKVCSEYGSVFAKRLGWVVGDGPGVQVKNSPHYSERIGQCPVCSGAGRE